MWLCQEVLTCGRAVVCAQVLPFAVLCLLCLPRIKVRTCACLLVTTRRPCTRPPLAS